MSDVKLIICVVVGFVTGVQVATKTWRYIARRVGTEAYAKGYVDGADMLQHAVEHANRMVDLSVQMGESVDVGQYAQIMMDSIGAVTAHSLRDMTK